MDYDGLRRLISVTGGPVIRQYTYRDIDSAKTTMQVASVTSGGQQYGYTYDSMGNIATYSAPGKGTITYTYDNQGQLLKAAEDTTYTYTYGHTNWKDLLTASGAVPKNASTASPKRKRAAVLVCSTTQRPFPKNYFVTLQQPSGSQAH